MQKKDISDLTWGIYEVSTSIQIIQCTFADACKHISEGCSTRRTSYQRRPYVDVVRVNSVFACCWAQTALLYPIYDARTSVHVQRREAWFTHPPCCHLPPSLTRLESFSHALLGTSSHVAEDIYPPDDLQVQRAKSSYFKRVYTCMPRRTAIAI